MSYMERRRFLWVLFLAGIALAAAIANSTTLARMSFDELAQKSSAVARLRCQSAQSHWDGGELWTETRYERSGCRSHSWRLELQRSRSGASRRKLCDRAATDSR